MDEIEKMHQVSMEWGCIGNLITKLGEEEDRIGWPEMIDMLSEAFDEAEKEKDPANIFFDWLQFFWRKYYYMKGLKAPTDFNQVYRENNPDHDLYRVVNYDYKMWIFLRKKGLMAKVTNAYCLVPMDKLSPGEKKSFEKKVLN